MLPIHGVAMVDRRLLQHWQGERRARERARAAVPRTWRDDPRPEMSAVCEAYVEQLTALRLGTRR